MTAIESHTYLVQKTVHLGVYLFGLQSAFLTIPSVTAVSKISQLTLLSTNLCRFYFLRLSRVSRNTTLFGLLMLWSQIKQKMKHNNDRIVYHNNQQKVQSHQLLFLNTGYVQSNFKINSNIYTVNRQIYFGKTSILLSSTQ